VVSLVFYDFEVFKHDWMVCILDTATKEVYTIINDKKKLEKAYKYYKARPWVGYNSRNFDQYILKGILAGFDPYDITDWIINKDKRGYEYSNLLSNFPLLNYDCSVGFRSLKELEAFMGNDIRETSVPFDIDRKLTEEELEEVKQYCTHDVMNTFEVFVETANEYRSHLGLISEFGLAKKNLSKTKAQISAMILDASPAKRDDEFDIRMPNTLEMGKYGYIHRWYYDWSEKVKDYSKTLVTDIAGVEHTLAFGGLHGAINNYIGDGHFLMADVASFYPAIMIEYHMLSRNVRRPLDYRKIRDERIVMKKAGDEREGPRKIVLNSTFGASKDPFNALYDPLQANNVCIAGQLLLVDLIDKLEGKCDLIQLT
jgi:hypothetical protein